MINRNSYNGLKRISLIFLASTSLHEVGARAEVPSHILDGNYVVVDSGSIKEINTDPKEYKTPVGLNSDKQTITDSKQAGDAIRLSDSGTPECLQGIRALVNKMKIRTKNTGKQVQHDLMCANPVDIDASSKSEEYPKWMLVDDSCQKSITTKKESKEHKKHNSNLVDRLFGCGQGLAKVNNLLIGIGQEREYVVVESITDLGQKVNNLLECMQGLASLPGKTGAQLIGLQEREYVVVEGITEDSRTREVARIAIKFQQDCKKHGKIQAIFNWIMNPILPTIAEKSGYKRQPTKQIGEMGAVDWINVSRRLIEMYSSKGNHKENSQKIEQSFKNEIQKKDQKIQKKDQSIAQRIYIHSLT